MRRISKFYGDDAAYKSMEFATKLILEGKEIPNLTGMLVSTARTLKNKRLEYSILKNRWAIDLDIVGLSSAIDSIVRKTGPVWDSVKSLGVDSIREEELYMKVSLAQWEAIKKINASRGATKQRIIWQSYQKSVDSLPVEVLRLKHEQRFRKV